MQFFEYLEALEKEVLVRAIADNLLGTPRKVSVRQGKLDATNFATLLGAEVDTDIPLAIDYYGYVKKSRGFKKYLMDIRESAEPSQIRSVSVPVVHFAALKVEMIAQLSPHLVGSFPWFKGQMLKLRGFNSNNFVVRRHDHEEREAS